MATLQENNSESTVDRFSDLPNEISHHILSTLSFKDSTRLGCVSKRCRGLHLSSPSVNFCGFSDGILSGVNDLYSCEVRKTLLDSLGRYLNQRGDKKIRCFRFSWSSHFLEDDTFDNRYDEGVCYCEEDHLQLSSWIDIAVRCNVEVVHLNPHSEDWYEFLPSTLFFCKSLKSLSMVGVKCYITEMTSTISNLKYLRLSNVRVSEGFWKWFSQSCKCIKELHVDEVSGSDDIIIDNTSLESFSFSPDCCNLKISGDSLEKLAIKWVARPNSSFKIYAPKLNLIEWPESFASQQQQYGEQSCLQVAYVSSFLEEMHPLALYLFLCSSRPIKALIMSEYILKVFLKECFNHPRLDGVRCLWLQNLVVTDDLIPARITVLKTMPNLICLIVKSMASILCYNESNCSVINIDFWKLENLAFVNKVMEVILDVYPGTNVLEFAKFVLAHAQKLEKMVIFHLPSQHEDVMKLQSKLNPNVTIIFHQFELSFNPSV